MRFDEGLVGEVELVVRDQARAVGKGTRARPGLRVASKGSQIAQASTDPRSKATRASVGGRNTGVMSE
jgi:hypothetical protein